MISARTMFTNDRFPRAANRDLTELERRTGPTRRWRTRVRAGATIGAGGTIGRGLEIGRFAMVGMGARGDARRARLPPGRGQPGPARWAGCAAAAIRSRRFSDAAGAEGHARRRARCAASAASADAADAADLRPE